ncbi:MAG: FixH family protein [Gammaproteobacteria bacterium]|nr:FixH family protein [Gammaproteobacteria bacterium]
MAMAAPKPVWYREPMVWMVILIPLTAVAMGVLILVLAIRSDDGLVVDDYYRQGKQINRVLARDRAAAARGLAGDVELDSARGELRVRLGADALPENIEFQLLHATRAGFDKQMVIPRGADGVYRAPLPELAPGRWNLQLSAQDWRLVGSLTAPAERRAAILPAIQ